MLAPSDVEKNKKEQRKTTLKEKNAQTPAERTFSPSCTVEKEEENSVI